MAKGILGKKIGMTQIFEADGRLIPVTVVEAGPCVVVQNKTEETDGYNAVQLGFGEVKEKHMTRPMKGHFDKAGVTPVKFVKELRLSAPSEYTVGQKISAEIFDELFEKVKNKIFSLYFFQSFFSPYFFSFFFFVFFFFFSFFLFSSFILRDSLSMSLH